MQTAARPQAVREQRRLELTEQTLQGRARGRVEARSTIRVVAEGASNEHRRGVRERRGRGQRGPGVLPRAPGTPETPTTRERFDAITLRIVAELDARWHSRLGLVEFAVEDIPDLPDDWRADSVPLAALVRGAGARPHRVVVFRRPIEHRCESRAEVEAMVLTVLVEQVAELLGIGPEDVDPRYEPH